MPSPESRDRRSAARGFVPILLANLIPLVGVVRAGWDPAVLVLIYALEVAVTFPLAGAKALFAQRPPRTDPDGAAVMSVSNELTRKRGSVEASPWLPPMYPRAVPFAEAILGAAVGFWIVIGIVLAEALPVADVIARPAVAVGVVALLGGQAVETWRDYLRDGRHETATPYTVIETPARRAFFLTFVLFAVPWIGSAGAELALVGFVLGKLLVEWSAHRASRGGGGRLAGWLAGPDASVEEVGPVRVPEGEPDARVPTDDRAVLCTGVLDTLARLVPFYAVWFLFVWLLTVVVLGRGGSSRGATIAVGVAVGGVFVGLLALEVAAFYLRYGPLEYRRYGDRLVAYDVLVDEPQWSTPVDVLRNVAIVPDRLPDRLLGTRTVAVTTGWGDGEAERYLGPVADPDALVAGFDLPVRTTELEPIDRGLAGVVVACVVAIVVATVTIGIGRWSHPASLLYGAFVFPFLALALRGLWNRAYPEPRR